MPMPKPDATRLEPLEGAPPGAFPAATYFAAGGARPAGYPAVLPFVPHLDVSVTVAREGMLHGPSAQWWGVPNPPALFDKLLRASLADGWIPVDDEDTPTIAAQVANLRRAARTRTIVAAIVGNTGLVTLSDRVRSL
ncbi:MAG: hypothetical protein JWM27_4410 [Gemmatimonadetes bacterium]|nr:hypothetical protein [Gemmatimonadota bacterium]